MKITYPVPAETTCAFVVAVDRASADLAAIVPWRIGRPHRRAAVAAFGTPRLWSTSGEMASWESR